MQARQTWLPLGAVVMAAVAMGLYSRSAPGPSTAAAPSEAQMPSQLYQIGDQEFLSMNSGACAVAAGSHSMPARGSWCAMFSRCVACAGSNEDLASMVEKLLAKEKVLLKKVRCGAA